MNRLLEQFAKKPSHAALITGPSETANAEAAELAQSLLAGYREGFKLVAPLTDKGKQNISIEQVRELNAFFRLKVPGEATIKRVAVVTSAEQMTIEAQNALLKTLEEPPADSVLLLVTGQPQNLLATIRSRVQAISLPHADVVPKAEAVQLVKQALSGTTYDRLLLVDSLTKQKEAATLFVGTLTAIALASLQAAARKQSAGVSRWQTILQAAHTAEEALIRNTSTKLVLTELMLAL